MIHLKSITRFGGSSSSHALAMAAPRRRARPTLSKVQLTSIEAAAMLAFLDGLMLVCSASVTGAETAGRDAGAGTGHPRRAPGTGIAPSPTRK